MTSGNMDFRESFAAPVRILEDLGDKLLVEAEIIHAGRTLNNTIYPEEELEAAVPTLMTPYPKPVLRHHIMWDDAIGRTVDASFIPNCVHNKPVVKAIGEITDPDAIEKAKDGRYSQISVGVHAKKVFCSICGADLTEEGIWDHEHIKGREYDGEIAGWILRRITFDEWSYVNMPADVLAGNIRVGDRAVAAPAQRASADPPPVSEGSKQSTEAPKGKDGKPINPMNTGTKKQAVYGHSILHGWWHKPSATNWTKDQIKKEHARVVRIMLNKGWGHPGGMKDSLDDTLPADLKRRTRALDKDKKGGRDRSAMDVTQGGTNSMKTVEQLQAELEALQEELSSANEAVERLETENKKTKEDLEKANNQLSEARSEIKEKDAKLKENEETIDELQKANESLTSDLTQALAERLADYRIVLGKTGFDERDETVKNLKERSLESLKDGVTDTYQEWSKVATETLVNSIQRPGAANPNEPGVHVPASQTGDQKLDEKSAFTALFSGLKNNRR